MGGRERAREKSASTHAHGTESVVATCTKVAMLTHARAQSGHTHTYRACTKTPTWQTPCGRLDVHRGLLLLLLLLLLLRLCHRQVVRV